MKKKLIFYAESRGIGGDSKYLYELINYLKKEDEYEIKCYCNSVIAKHLHERIALQTPVETINTKHAEYPDFKIVYTNYLIRKIICVFREIKILHFQLLRIYYILTNIFTVYKYFRKKKCDIVHINNGGYPGAEGCISAVFAAKIGGIPKIIMSVHNLARDKYYWSSFFESIIDRMVGKYVNKIVVATDSVRNTLVQKRKIQKSLIEKISYGINLPDGQYQDNNYRKILGVSENTKVLIVSARFDGTKGQEYLLEALTLLKHKYRNFKCYLLGEGPLRNKMMELSKQLNLQEHVVFTGYRKDVNNFLSIADIFVQPSVSYENSPYSILEAMSYGIPVIGTSIGGVPELIKDGINGLIIPPRDSQVLCDAIFMLVTDENRPKLFGLAGKKRIVEEFNMEISIKKMKEIYSVTN